MARPEKVAVVEATKKAAEKATSIVLADFTGLNVEQDTELRRKLRERAIDYRVIKNRLASISFKELGYDALLEHLEGPTAFAFSYDDPSAPVRLLLTFNKKLEKPKIKAIWFEGQLYLGNDAQKIVDLPSRPQLIGKFIGGLNAPLVSLVSNLKGMLTKLVGTLDAVQKIKANE